MRPFSNNVPIVQNDDLIRVQNGADSLRHYDHGAVHHFFFKSSPKTCVGLEIQRGKAVVKDINIRLLYNSPCNGEPLLLSSGKVITALRYRIIESLICILNKISNLCNLCRMAHFFYGCVLFPVSQIIRNRPAEQKGFLRYISNFVPKFL